MKKGMFVLLVTVGIGAIPGEAFAGCFEDMAVCFQRAATRNSFLSRSFAGADCELDFIECSRKKLLGR